MPHKDQKVVVPFSVHRLEQVHSEAPFKSPLFRTNYYSIVLIRQGQGCYVIDDQSYATQDRTIYFTNPGHIKGFELEQVAHGYIVTFSEAFLKQSVHADIFDEFPFLIAEVAPPHYPEPPVFEEFDKLGNQLIAEFESSSPYKFKVIGSLTVVLLLRIKEWFWKGYDPLNESDTGSAIALTFKRNLENHFRDLLDGKCDRSFQVQDYADAQYLHPSYFSTVIKRKTGKPVNTWIAEKTIAEAQALLSRSSQPVQEIAFRLGFKDAAHFSRFFKKHAQCSPSQFRQQA
ncbi:AraC family transcriptional regulator [Oscillatoria sp. CS-180]|uniref:helix-turn-helix domain-containing protein n=1 Tax=Oscillatoria sp. CS-180 TaxID=3021720 RepID=UPI0023311B16|nr:AraC family transcriptional regulator [Oscillatoria sp. CS-180]MDB9527580.1 AraC family transcriptional regulator [Oscillatoria sp. CS-180]